MSGRTHSDEFKAKVVAELMAGAKVPELAKKYELRDSLIYQWRLKKHGSQKKSVVKTNKRVITLQEKQRAVAALNAGGNAKAIAKQLQVSDASVYNWRKNGHAKGRAKVKPKVKPETSRDQVHDAILSLRQAADGMGPAKSLRESELLTLLALRALEGRG